jgi:tagatose-1,6-bisphosphate aldolase non-catalytic subunit AgaZ/GatZ
LSGQYLYGAVESGGFPSNRIRVYWNSERGITYGVQSLGDRLLPIRLIAPPSPEVVDDGVLPTDRDVIGQSIQDVIQALSRKA